MSIYSLSRVRKQGRFYAIAQFLSKITCASQVDLAHLSVITVLGSIPLVVVIALVITLIVVITTLVVTLVIAIIAAAAPKHTSEAIGQAIAGPTHLIEQAGTCGTHCT